ncbi:hypothetical protein ACWEJP_09830 [Streptomyces sp. NPDC004749]
MTQTSAGAGSSGPQGIRSRPGPRRGLGRRTGPGPAFGVGPGRLPGPLGTVACAYTLLQLVLVVPGTGLGWDETVYVTQVSPGVDPAFFSAPRARGITYLIAPVTLLTPSVTALRIYLALLSGLGLFLAFRVWRRLCPEPVLALAGALFAGLWITLLYGPQAMPNLWVAFGSLFAVGCFLRAVQLAMLANTAQAGPSVRSGPHGRSGLPAALLGLGAGVAFVGLMRPVDALWLALPLTAASLFVRRWRRPALLLVLMVGAALGWAQWVAEAYAQYGGPVARLRRAGEIQGGLGWNLAVDDQVRSLDGRLLCRPCDVPWRRPVTAVWFFALPLFTLGGILVAARLRRLPVVLLPALVGLSLGVQYLLLIGYAAPRFLLPMYALLALPVALCMAWIVRGLVQRHGRRLLQWHVQRLAGTAGPQRSVREALAVSALALALVAHLAVQYAVLDSAVRRGRVSAAEFGRAAAELNRLGVRAPCVVIGEEAVRVAHRAGCASRQVGGHDGSITPAGIAALARERPVAVVVEGDDRPPAYARGWRAVRLPRLPGRDDVRAYLSPAVPPDDRPSVTVEVQMISRSSPSSASARAGRPCGPSRCAG